MGWFACVSADARRVQKRVSDLLEFELQVPVRHATQVLGNNPGSNSEAPKVGF